jgi:2'-5' RNA ligase
MRQLYTLAYPTLSPADVAFIDGFRRRHDSQHAMMRAHFTLAFGCAEVEDATYLAHVAQLAKSVAPIEFVCRYAMLGADHGGGRAYVYLVPDEGYSALSRLHDAAYQGVLAPHLQLHVPYVPHITVGAGLNARDMKRLCDGLNVGGLEVRGRVEALVVVAVEEGALTEVGEFALS